MIKLQSAYVTAPCHGKEYNDGSHVVERQDSEEPRLEVVESVLRRKPFYFQQRNGKLDMRAIGRVDLDRVIREVDVDCLQMHLENLTFSDICEDDLRLYSDDCFLKLFQLSQMTLEYLLSVQDTLASGLEDMAARYAHLQRELLLARDKQSRGEEHVKTLRREVRQKRRTIAKYEQLLTSMPPAPVEGKSLERESTTRTACTVCGKLFKNDTFLQQHEKRKHAPSSAKASLDMVGAEELSRRRSEQPELLHLYVHTADGRCMDTAARATMSVGEFKESLEGIPPSQRSSSRLRYRGAVLQETATLAACGIPTESQLMLIDIPRKEEEEKREVPSSSSQPAAESEQVKALVQLLKQQMDWAQQQREAAATVEISVADALEKKVRDVELALPQRIEAHVEESLSDFKEALRQEMADMRVGKSNAGDMLPDDDKAISQTPQAAFDLHLSELTDEVARFAADNAALRDELQKLRNSFSASPQIPAPVVTESPVAKPQVVHESRAAAVVKVGWDLVFSAEGARPEVIVKVAPADTASSVCVMIADELDCEEGRVVLLQGEERKVVMGDTPAATLRKLYDEGMLKLEIRTGAVLSDSQVDDLVDYYEKAAPRAVLLASPSLQKSMASVDRHVPMSTSRSPRSRSPSPTPGASGGTFFREGDVEMLANIETESKMIDARNMLSRTLGSTWNVAGEMDSDGSVSPVPDSATIRELERSIETYRQQRPPEVARALEEVKASVDKQLQLHLSTEFYSPRDDQSDSLASDSVDQSQSIDGSRNSFSHDSRRGVQEHSTIGSVFAAPLTPDTGRGDQSSLELSASASANNWQDSNPLDLSESATWMRTVDSVSVPKSAEERADEHEYEAKG